MAREKANSNEISNALWQAVNNHRRVSRTRRFDLVNSLLQAEKETHSRLNGVLGDYCFKKGRDGGVMDGLDRANDILEYLCEDVFPGFISQDACSNILFNFQMAAGILDPNKVGVPINLPNDDIDLDEEIDEDV